MKKSKSILWGIILIALGVIFALNALEITSISIFFEGWWTLFIIIPCLVGLFTDGDKSGNLFGIAIGVFLLLCAQDILSFALLWKLLVPTIIVLIGVRMIFSALSGGKSQEIMKRLKASGAEFKTGVAVFSGTKLNFSGEVFEGVELEAIFGGVACDLSGAVINGDCVINATAVFGGIDIFVPAGINVKIISNSIFGGVSNKRNGALIENAPTLYINANCMFGGVDIK